MGIDILKEFVRKRYDAYSQTLLRMLEMSEQYIVPVIEVLLLSILYIYIYTYISPLIWLKRMIVGGWTQVQLDILVQCSSWKRQADQLEGYHCKWRSVYCYWDWKCRNDEWRRTKWNAKGCGSCTWIRHELDISAKGMWWWLPGDFWQRKMHGYRQQKDWNGYRWFTGQVGTFHYEIKLTTSKEIIIKVFSDASFRKNQSDQLADSLTKPQKTSANFNKIISIFNVEQVENFDVQH